MRQKSREDTVRVLFVVPSLRRAGAETQVVDLVNALDRSRFQVYLFTFQSALDQYCRLDHNKIAFYNKPRKYKLDCAIVKTIADVIAKERIHIVYCTLQM